MKDLYARRVHVVRDVTTTSAVLTATNQLCKAHTSGQKHPPLLPHSRDGDNPILVHHRHLVRTRKVPAMIPLLDVNAFAVDALHVQPMLGLGLVLLEPELLEEYIASVVDGAGVAAGRSILGSEGRQLGALDLACLLAEAGCDVSAKGCLRHAGLLEVGVDLAPDFVARVCTSNVRQHTHTHTHTHTNKRYTRLLKTT